MSRLQQIIHELHRRSIWQVLGIYLVGAWIVMQVIEVLTESAGLPDWTPGFAIVLLLVGLPICIATAVVQEGGPGAGSANGGTGPVAQLDPTAADSGVEAATQEARAQHEAVPRPSTGSASTRSVPPQGKRHRFLTWRNAMIGGIGAFALLGLTVFGYFVMWSTGVGPVGSLVAQGVIEERDPVVLADFRNSTDQDGLGNVVTAALRVDLIESPVLALVPPNRIDEVLGLMGRESGSTLTPQLAREVAQREGYKAVIEGEIATAGSAYVISASVVAAESGDLLKAFRETARDDDEVVDAIDKISQRIREGTGESLRSIRNGEPLERATTASLDALKKLMEAEAAEERGDYPTAIALLEEAVLLDPGFAMAYRKIAVLHSNSGIDPSRGREAATLAYENRDRLTERERYLAEAYYHSEITEDGDAVILAYRNALRVAPDESAALNNLALVLLDRNEYDEAEQLLERAVGGPGASSVAHSNLVRVRLYQGDTDGAREAYAQYRERYPTHIFLSWIGTLVALHSGDADAVHETTRAYADNTQAPRFARPSAWTYAVAFDVGRGKVDEARGHMRQAIGVAETLGVPSAALELALDEAALDIDFSSDPGSALSKLHAALETWASQELPAREHPFAYAAELLARAGQPGEARALLARADLEFPEAERRLEDRTDFARAHAAILSSEDDHTGALSAYRGLQSALKCTRCFRLLVADELELEGQLPEAAALRELGLIEPRSLREFPYDRLLALRSLGPLYEQMGDSAKAAQHYAAFAEAWSDADPGLQPEVDRARAKATALGGGG